MSKLKLALSLALLIFIWSVPCQSAGPEDSLRQIQQSIDRADSGSFLELVDLDALIDQALLSFFEQAKKNASKMPPLVNMLLLQAGGSNKGGEAIRGLLHGEARAFVLNGINSGAFGGKKVNNYKSAGSLAPLFANASLGRKEITDIGEPNARDGAWLVPFWVHDYGSDGDYPVIGVFKPVNGKLKLTSVTNFDQLFDQLLEESLN